jgi:putative Ca2+/H+ antiporter (TMEM165/GDT1 family)
LQVDSASFWAAFGLIFVAELGDKTQLIAVALATRYRWERVFLGIAAAFVVLNLAAVTVGSVLFSHVPLFWIRLGAGALFAVFGVSALRAVPGDGEEAGELRAGRPIVTAFVMILFAELGDKTQLATASLAAQKGALAEVFAGSSLALWSVSLVAVLVGRQLTRYVPLRHVRRAGGILFLAFAAASFYQALA